MNFHEYRADGTPMGQRPHTRMQRTPRQTAFIACGGDDDESMAVGSVGDRGDVCAVLTAGTRGHRSSDTLLVTSWVMAFAADVTISMAVDAGFDLLSPSISITPISADFCSFSWPSFSASHLTSVSPLLPLGIVCRRDSDPALCAEREGEGEG
jgi:hypothetical protein